MTAGQENAMFSLEKDNDFVVLRNGKTVLGYKSSPDR
jgi:hypothetical protein